MTIGIAVYHGMYANLQRFYHFPASGQNLIAQMRFRQTKITVVQTKIIQHLNLLRD